MAEHPIKTLKALREAEAACRRCQLFRYATQVVPGEGRVCTRLMLVGEQPGDQEDRQGKPFVGPAGRVLAQALEEAGIERRQVFITNAVKHFKFELRGKRRLHKHPNAYEIERCRWWLDIEHELIKPDIVITLGATALHSLSRKAIAINKVRGRMLLLPHGGRMLATIHPSWILRIEDEADKKASLGRRSQSLRAGAG